MWNIYTVDYYSGIKKKKYCCLQQHGLCQQGIMLGEINQRKKNTILSHFVMK